MSGARSAGHAERGEQAVEAGMRFVPVRIRGERLDVADVGLRLDGCVHDRIRSAGVIAGPSDRSDRRCQVDRKVVPAISRVMHRSGIDPTVARDRARQGFDAARMRVVERLVRDGMPSGTAEPLVDEWLRSTEMLVDFRAAPDFWRLAYQFALEEHRRRRTAG